MANPGRLHSQLLKEELRRPGRSQSALARYLNLDPSIVNKLVNGKRELKEREVDKIYEYLESTEHGGAPIADRLVTPRERSGLLPDGFGFHEMESLDDTELIIRLAVWTRELLQAKIKREEVGRVVITTSQIESARLPILAVVAENLGLVNGYIRSAIVLLDVADELGHLQTLDFGMEPLRSLTIDIVGAPEPAGKSGLYLRLKLLVWWYSVVASLFVGAEVAADMLYRESDELILVRRGKKE